MTIKIKKGIDNCPYDKRPYKNINPVRISGSTFHMGIKSPSVNMH
jgi:hypothetical protein